MKLIEKFKKSGITEQTPKNMLLNAAVLYRNLKYEDGKWYGDLIGATSGGVSIVITPDIQQIEVDGATVAVRGLEQKWGETAYMEASLIELTPEIIKESIVARQADSPVPGYTLYETKALLDDGDYVDNIAAIGTKSDGTEVIVIMENMLCTSGFQADTKNKDKAVLKCKFTCHAGFDDDHTKLPIHIYYPNKPEQVVTYTEDMLSDMTVSQIEEVAQARGYTLTGSTKTEKITAFLEAQNEAQNGGN
ncbi:MAG: hypothetical protein HDR21_12110 [Lachnospiraceae bacterium]|nr:hypothetical protein [Lachnospiraceae bacterium]